MNRFFEAIGRVCLRIMEEFGRFFTMFGRVAGWTVRPPYDIRELLRQMGRVGVDSIPVVFLTAKNQVADINDAQRAGSDLYLTKPFLPGRLLKMLDIFLADLHLARKGTAPSPATSSQGSPEPATTTGLTPPPGAGRAQRAGELAKPLGRPHAAHGAKMG